MQRSVRFYKDLLGLELVYGSYDSEFSSIKLTNSFVNLSFSMEPISTGWGRFIIHVHDVDQMFEILKAEGVPIENEPQNASWRERYIHVWDPDGHSLSLAQPM